MRCPHEIVKGRHKDGLAVQCEVMNAQLGWGHGFPVKVGCAVCPDQDGREPRVEAMIEHLRRVRVMADSKRFDGTWKGAPAAAVVMAALEAEHGYGEVKREALLVAAAGWLARIAGHDRVRNHLGEEIRQGRLTADEALGILETYDADLQTLDGRGDES